MDRQKEQPVKPLKVKVKRRRKSKVRRVPPLIEFAVAYKPGAPMHPGIEWRG